MYPTSNRDEMEVYKHLGLGSRLMVDPNQVAIFQLVDRFDSITAAATAVGMTYRQTWTPVQLFNERFGFSGLRPIDGVPRWTQAPD